MICGPRIRTLEEELAERNKLYDKLKIDYDGSVNAYGLLQTNYDVLDEKEKSLRIDWDGLNSRFGLLETEHNNLILTNNTLMADFDSYKASATQRLEALQKDYDALKLKFDDLSVQLENSKKLRLQLEADIDKLKADIAALQKELNDSKTAYAELTAKYNDLVDVKNTLEEAKAKLETQIAALTNEKNGIAAELDNYKRTSTEQITLLNSNMSVLQGKYDGLRTDYDGSSLKLTELEGIRNNLQAELDHLRLAKSNVDEKVKQLLAEIEDLKSQLAKMSAAKDESDVRCSQLVGQLDKLADGAKLDESIIKELEVGAFNLYKSFRHNHRIIQDLELGALYLKDNNKHDERVIQDLELGHLDLRNNLVSLQNKIKEGGEWKVKYEGLVGERDAQRRKIEIMTDEKNYLSDQILRLKEEHGASLESANNRFAKLEKDYKNNLGQKDNLILKLSNERDKLLSQLSAQNDLENVLESLKKEHTDSLAIAESNYQKLADECTEDKGKKDKQIAALQAEIAELKSKIEEQDEELDEKALTLKRIREKARSLDFTTIGTASSEEKDDLQLIKGIGPFIEEKLHALNIFTFRQVANFTSEIEDKVNEAIEFFPGRIKRDEWAKQAKDFLKGKE